MGEKRGMKALEAWCRKVTDGYRDVAVQNMSSSWRDGLAFCAIIHHFRPDLIDYDSLTKENIHYNNELAFTVAEKTLGIPSLLDAEDMVKYSVPDKLSIMTYVSQFYQFFENSGHHARSPVKTAVKHPVESPVSSASSPGSPPGKVLTSSSSSSPTPRQPLLCQICQNRVYILERLIIDNKLYHRTCFKCCRCNSVLKPAAYVDGPSPGQYECTSCPDEEAAETAAIASMATSRLAQQNLSSPMTWELPAVISPRRTYDIKPLTSPSAEARKLFLSTSVSEVGEEDRNVKNSGGVNESGSFKQFSSVSSYLFGSKDVEKKLSTIDDEKSTESETNKSILNVSGNNGVKYGNEVIEEEQVVTSQCTAIYLADSSSDAETSVNVGSEKEKTLEDESKTSFLTADSKLSESLHDSEASTNKLDVPSKLRPVPSPRRSRKQDTIVQSKNADNGDKSAEEVFTTPRTSPRVHLRKKSTEAAVGGRTTPALPVRKTFQLPVREVSLSLTETKANRPVSESTLSPSKSGKVVLGMPIIQSQINRRMLSPPRTMERKLQTSKKEDAEISSEKTLPETILDTADKSCTERVEIVKKPTSPLNGVENKSPGTHMATMEDESDVPESAELYKEVKKTPPPRPQLPSVLIKTHLPTEKKQAEEKTDTKLESDSVEYPEDLNPFSMEDEDVENDKVSKKKKSSIPSLNPFDESDEEFEDALNSEEMLTSTPENLSKRSISPKGLNPFDEDEEDESSTDVSASENKSFERPVPLPRTGVSSTAGSTARAYHSASSSPAHSLSKASGQHQLPSTSSSPAVSPPSSLSRETGQRYSFQESLNVSPTGSISRGTRKKRPAPRPPIAKALFTVDTTAETKTSRSCSPHHYHKKSPAPLPPPLQSARHDQTNDEINEKTLKDLGNISLKMKETRNNQESPEKCSSPDHCTASGGDAAKYNTFGYWKRKKKLAPPIPLPPKRQTGRLNWEEIEKELGEIEKKQLELEEQGVELEKAIREKLTDDATDGDEENVLIIQLFELVNQKNVLFRRQSELVYIKRQQRLEEEHAELEFQIRCLMGKPECTKSTEEHEQEEVLISRLVEIVKQRNEIIESIETDRLREAAEDENINEQLAVHQAGSSRSSLNSQGSSTSVDKVGKKEQKKNGNGEDGECNSKEKENSKERDEDKDLDDVEIIVSEKKKKQKKHKWF